MFSSDRKSGKLIQTGFGSLIRRSCLLATWRLSFLRPKMCTCERWTGKLSRGGQVESRRVPTSRGRRNETGKWHIWLELVIYLIGSKFVSLKKSHFAEGSDSGSLEWRIELPQSAKIGKVDLNLSSAVYESGNVQWRICGEEPDICFVVPKGNYS